MTQAEKTVYEFGEFSFDKARRQIERAGGEILPLPLKALDVLQMLVENAGETVGKGELMKKVWANTFVEESNLTQMVYLLRKALGANDAGQPFIQTQPKRGYRFVGIIKSPPSRENVLSQDEKVVGKIVVLPFENESSDRENDFLAEGLSENLIDALSQIPQLKVVARNSAFKYKGMPRDAKEIARALGVRFLLDGRIAQRGEKTLIRAELVDAEQEIQMWGKTVECLVCDLQEILAEITQNVVEKLGLKLTAAQKNTLAKHHTPDPEAFQAYLNGLFFYRLGGAKNAFKALEFYDRATALDPNFALAYASQPVIYAFLSEGYLDRAEAYQKARNAAAKALALDDRLPQSHIAAAAIKKWDSDIKGAEREYLRAIELNPNNAAARNNYALVLSAFGRDSEALVQIETAKGLDPLVLQIEVNKSLILINAGRFDEALDLLEILREKHADVSFIYSYLGSAYEGKNLFREAIAANRRLIRLEGENNFAELDIVINLLKLGEETEARRLLNDLKKKSNQSAPLHIATIHELEGKREAALQVLEEGFARRDPVIHFLRADFRLKSLHAEPRFRELVRKIGLSE